MSAEILQFRDYQPKRDSRALEREAAMIVDQLFAFAEQSHYHNLPVLDTAPCEMPPEAS